MSFHKHEEKKVIIYTKMQIDKGDTWIIPYEDNDSPYWKFEYNNGSFFFALSKSDGHSYTKRDT